MTSKTSLNKFHPALNLFQNTVKRNIGLIILITIFLLLVCPGYVIAFINDYLKASQETTYDFSKLSYILIPGIAISTSIIAVVFCFINFSYLFQKKSVDVFHALPLTRRGLLFTRYLASVIPVLIPILLTYVSMLGLLAFKNVTGDVKTILYGLLYNIILMMMCSAFTLIFIVCAGSVVDLVISYLTVNIGVILVVSIFVEFCSHYLLGFSNNTEMNLMIALSPFLFGFYNYIGYLAEGFVIGNGIIIYTFKLILITVISLVISHLLYNKRKSEKSGVSYAYNFMYVICSLIVGIIGAFVLGLIFANGSYDSVFWIFAVIGGVLTSITFGVITDRGFKSVKKTILYGCSSVAVMGITAFILFFGCFGFAKRIPKENSIKTATVQFSNNGMDFTNPDIVLDLHEKIVENIDELELNDYANQNVTLRYTLKGGRIMERLFYIDQEKYMDELLNIYRSDENVKSIKRNMAQFTDSNLTLSKNVYLFDEDENIPENDVKPITNVYLTKAELDSIIDAYVLDIKDATEKSIERSDIIEYSFNGLSSKYNYLAYQIYVEDGFTRTNKVLDSLKLSEREQLTETNIYQ